MVKTKPEAAQSKFQLFVRYSFHVNAKKVSPRNVSFIEHLLRKGTRQVEQYEDSNVTDCWVSQDMADWDRNQRLEGLHTPRARKN